MNEIGDIIQEDLSSVVKYIPNHLSTWKTVQNLMISEHQILTSQSEEYIHVNSVHCYDYDKDLQERIQILIKDELDETLQQLQNKIEHLREVTNNMRNVFMNLEEKLTLDLNFHIPSKIRDGSASQPPMSELLLLIYEYIQLFSQHIDKMDHTFLNIHLNDIESIHQFEKSINIDFNDSIIENVLIMTQFMT